MSARVSARRAVWRARGARLTRLVARLPVLVAALVALGGAVARAQGAPAAPPGRRPVAVVNLDLTGAAEPQALATELVAALDAHPALRALPVAGAIAALYEPIRDDDAPRLADAQRNLDAALEQLAELDPAQALRFTESGQRALLAATPALAVARYAELAFVAGVALHDLGRLDEARAAFAHCARLEPGRVPDPARYVPSVVQLYQAARASVAGGPPLAGAPAPGALEVQGAGTVWLDGAEVGVAPARLPVAPGHHVVWLTGVDRETRGERVFVAPGQTQALAIPDAPADARTRLQRARLVLARAPDPTARAAAIRRLAELAGARDAVLIALAGATLIVQTWRAGDVERAPGFSALRERGAATAAELLAPLAPPPPPVVLTPPPPEIPRRPPARRWHQRRSVRAAFVVTALGVLVGGVALATRDPGWFQGGFQPDIVNIDPGTAGRR